MVPTCKVCKGTGAGVEFPLFVIPAPFKFGEICKRCCFEIEKAAK